MAHLPHFRVGVLWSQLSYNATPRPSKHVVLAIHASMPGTVVRDQLVSLLTPHRVARFDRAGGPRVVLVNAPRQQGTGERRDQMGSTGGRTRRWVPGLGGESGCGRIALNFENSGVFRENRVNQRLALSVPATRRISHRPTVESWDIQQLGYRSARAGTRKAPSARHGGPIGRRAPIILTRENYFRNYFPEYIHPPPHPPPATILVK